MPCRPRPSHPRVAPPVPARRGVSPLTWVLAAVAVAAVALLLWILLREDGTDPASTPTSTPETSQPAQTTEAPPTTENPTPTPTPTTESPSPSPSPSATEDPAADVETALSAFSDEVGVQDRDGALDKNAAKTLDDGVRNLRRALRDGDSQKVSEETDKLVEGYDKGVDDGSITPEASQQLDPLLADLRDAVDTYAAA